MPADAASVLSGNREDCFRAGSMLNTFTQHGYPPGRLGPDAVAMHSMRRTPPVGWGFQEGQNGPNDKTPEIPYDGRRLAPYHGMPIMEHDGYSELPG